MNDDESSLKKSRAHRAYRRSKGGAEKLLNNPDQLSGLVGAVKAKLNNSRVRVDEFGGSLQAVLRLLKARASGQYSETPWNSLLLIIAALLYFLMPFDSLPDLIPFWGYVDDIALLSWTLRQIRHDLDLFLAWENEHPTEEKAPSLSIKESDDG